jgi:hypothetical protein
MASPSGLARKNKKSPPPHKRRVRFDYVETLDEVGGGGQTLSANKVLKNKFPQSRQLKK